MRISYHDFLSLSLSPLSFVSKVHDYCLDRIAFQFKAKGPIDLSGGSKRGAPTRIPLLWGIQDPPLDVWATS